MQAFKTRASLAAVGVALLVSACTGLPEGVESVPAVDPERYLGTWYAST